METIRSTHPNNTLMQCVSLYIPPILAFQMNCCKQEVAGKRVVVIGGGYSGMAVASLLDGDFRVTVIEPRAKLVHKIGGVRACVRSEWAEPILVPQKKVMMSGRILNFPVQSIDTQAKKVFYKNGNNTVMEVPFDYLVIASGGHSLSPAEPPASADMKLHDHYVNVAVRIAASRKIVIIGGGPVGVELAGEIMAKHPKKDLTLIHQGSKLCDNIKATAPSDFSIAIKSKLEGKGVKVQLNTTAKLTKEDFNGKAYLEGKRNVELSYGQRIEDVDLVLMCAGYVPSTSFLPAKMLNDKKLVKVDAKLRVRGEQEVFSIGDCNDVNETKKYVTAVTKEGKMDGWPRGQADVVADNIRALAEGKAELSSYEPNNKYFGYIIPIGPNDSVVAGFPDNFGAFKASTFFIAGQWEAANLAAPELPTL